MAKRKNKRLTAAQEQTKRDKRRAKRARKFEEKK